MGPPLDSPTDDDLAAGVARREHRALAEIYRRHGGAVWSLARRVLADDHRAAEVCRTVFTDVWSSPERFDSRRGTLRTWLLTQTHGRCVDAVRSDAVRSDAVRRRRDDRDARLAAARAGPDVGAVVDEAAVADEVRHALDLLPPDERAAVVLTWFAGHSYRQAAARLGQAEGTVKRRIRSGLRRLRRALEAEGVMR
ncbi:MAG TPA: sigma-70 family RNA polymerase sigma factor [Acidimicrobiales bacterium]|nr:sigma-70 family RNA polymerase sigma factor [Acidimicrobiales bacterium]